MDKKTKAIAITAVVTAVAIGYLMKSGREEVAKNPAATPLAKTLGLI